MYSMGTFYDEDNILDKKIELFRRRSGTKGSFPAWEANWKAICAKEDNILDQIKNRVISMMTN